MAKRRRKSKKTNDKSSTNWILIGIIVGIGVIGLFALLMYSVYGTDSGQASASNNLALSEYCDQNEDRCITDGSIESPVKLLEISDFGCNHCRSFHQETAPILKEKYVDTGQVEWVSLPYALRDTTLPAANAAFCANDEGKYFEFSEALFNNPDPQLSLTREGFLATGEEVGLEIESFTECLAQGTYNNIIRANQQAAQGAGVNATPTFIVNGEVVRGNVPLSEFERIINASLSGS